MKFCPFCGADLPGGATAFCTECGKELPPKGNAAGKQSKKKTGSPRRQPDRAHPPRRPRRDPMDENYDGYYDDVKPIDAGARSEGMDPELLKRVGFIVFGAVGLISVAIILMMLL